MRYLGLILCMISDPYLFYIFYNTSIRNCNMIYPISYSNIIGGHQTRSLMSTPNIMECFFPENDLLGMWMVFSKSEIQHALHREKLTLKGSFKRSP